MVVAKIFVMLLAVLITPASANGKAYRYIKESLLTQYQSGFRDFIGMANMPYFRMFHPQPFGVARWTEFLAQQQAEGLSEERASRRYSLALRGEPLLDDELSTALMQDNTYRAHVFAYAILYSLLPNVERNQKEMIDIATASQAIVPLVMAIDGDHTLNELASRVLNLLQYMFVFQQHRDLTEQSNSSTVFGHVGNYLMRSNKEVPEDEADFQATQLQHLGFTAEEVNALSYRARDAIIITDFKNKDDFVKHANAVLNLETFDVEAINAVVADSGPLVFVLTLPQFDYYLEEINKHDIDELVKIFNFR